MIAIIFCIFLTEIVVCRSDNIDGWAPVRGSSWGVLNEMQCPNDGVITGIRYRSSNLMERLGFYCTSSKGETLVGPFGGANDNTCIDEKCPQGMYIKSIYGRGAAALDAFGITCVKFEGGEKIQFQLHGGYGGAAYDDESFEPSYKKPFSVRVWASNDVITGIQVKYGSAPTNTNTDGWAPVRGSSWGVLNEVQCPNEGVITGIRYRSSNLVERLGFYCTSSKGETLVGPFGGANDNTCIDEKCPQGMYIKSIYGRGAAALDAFGLTCVKLDGGEKVQLQLHGGYGGAAYDDETFTVNGKRPTIVRVWASNDVITGVQLKYGSAKSTTSDGWAPVRGSSWGVLNEVQCPNDGVITGIRYRSSNLVERLGFYCTSSKGETLVGPFGGANDNTCIDEKCPQGMYIKSIYGRGAAALDAFGINCVKFEGGEKVQLKLHGGNGGAVYDDENFTISGRPTIVRVWASNDVITGVQLKYGSAPTNTNTDGWAPVRGSSWGVLNEVQCPNEGVITGIRYRSSNLVERLGFYCTSSKGETLVGPFGGANDNTCIDEKCPQGMYIKSIYGRGAAALDAFGINCVKFEGGEKVQLKLHGGSGGAAYEDENFTVNGKRPTIVRVWASNNVITGIQIKYDSAKSTTSTTSLTSDGWAPVRGSSWGVLNEIQCPHNGVITGIRYRSSNLVERLGFYCTSSKGETLVGPFGNANDNTCIDDKCPQGMYIKSIYGRGAAALDAFGINCVKFEGGEKVQLKLHGGNGGAAYDDENFTISGRPTIVRVWASYCITGIQVKYGSAPTNTNADGWAPVRGSSWGVLNEVQCPNDGVITGIRYRSSNLVERLGFYCTSSKGETLVGPFGGANDNTCIDEKCPQGMFIKSIYGRGAAALDAFGINCVKFEGGEKVQLQLHGGYGGAAYDDENFTVNGKRPTIVRVWASNDVITGVQIKYTNVPLPTFPKTKEEVWGPVRGWDWGVLNEVQCPNGGQITGIRYRSSNLVERLGFYCTSYKGETLVGPFGGENDNTCIDEKCPQGTYMKSIYGRADTALDAIGVNCEADGGQKMQLKLHGGNGGEVYDDDNLGGNGKRPSSVKVWASNNLITAVQVKYSN